MEKQKAIEIPASERYDSPYSGEQETAILQYAEKLKDQTAASDGDTVQVYDVDGNPHKVAKSELLKKSTLALPDLSDISKFVAVNAKGDAIGLMTKEQVAQVLGELMLKRGQLPNHTDLNTLQSNAVYYVSGWGSPNYENFPTGDVYLYGILIVLTPMPGSVIQIYVPDSADISCYIRSLNSDWKKWRKFSGVEL